MTHPVDPRQPHPGNEGGSAYPGSPQHHAPQGQQGPYPPGPQAPATPWPGTPAAQPAQSGPYHHPGHPQPPASPPGPSQQYPQAPQQPPQAPQQPYPGVPPVQPPFPSAAPASGFAPHQPPQAPPQQVPQWPVPPQQQPAAPPQQPAHAPGFPPPHDQAGIPQARRGADSSSITTLLLNLPLFLGSLLVVWLVSRLLPSGLDVVFVIAWLASGALMFHRPTEHALARLYFRMRVPTSAELAHLQPIWDQVTRQAGIDGSAYDLWMEDTDELNASAAAGHIVCVTRGAMRQLPPDRLAAVLAHELGHHMGGHAWSGLLGIWYALPARVFMWLMKLVLTFLFFFTAELSCLAVGVFVVVVGAVAIATFVAFPPAVALYAIPFLLAWSGRQGELRADRFAGQIGYGPVLLAVFTAWQAEGHDDEARKRGPIARLMSTHPPFHQRIRALETFVS
ncbi:M48 family metalloprotease [Streptomyces puniciscabiei]|uniref:M48 family metalloprotease n=1 Tax=Streptomyces puniciscabiei TaxID=164348 RepID=UPI00331D3033